MVDRKGRVSLIEINSSPAVAEDLLPKFVKDLVDMAIDPPSFSSFSASPEKTEPGWGEGKVEGKGENTVAGGGQCGNGGRARSRSPRVLQELAPLQGNTADAAVERRVVRSLCGLCRQVHGKLEPHGRRKPPGSIDREGSGSSGGSGGRGGQARSQAQGQAPGQPLLCGLCRKGPASKPNGVPSASDADAATEDPAAGKECVLLRTASAGNGFELIA
jgi:hypothetical protein